MGQKYTHHRSKLSAADLFLDLVSSFFYPICLQIVFDLQAFLLYTCMIY